MTNKVDMADVCELAHLLTEQACERLKIPVDCKSKKDCGDKNNSHNTKGFTHYTKKAQEIFDEFYDLIINTLKV